jgi:2-iminoacetate synthase
MELAKTGTIGRICVPNALATFKEYLNDFASDETKKTSEEFLKKEIKKVKQPTRDKVEKMIARVDEGERDVFF